MVKLPGHMYIILLKVHQCLLRYLILGLKNYVTTAYGLSGFCTFIRNSWHKNLVTAKKDCGILNERRLRKDCLNCNQNEENSMATNKVNLQEIDNINSPSTPESNKNYFQGVCSPREPNGTPDIGDIRRGSNMSDPNELIYYAVHIPLDCPEIPVERKEGLHVYTDKEEVFNIIKLNKKARFKQFKSREEAEDFAINGSETLLQDGTSAIADSEKALPFKRPKTEDMIQFRKDIERGDSESVMEKIFENPKYLVSNGDTPSILQEGSRYNALHVAAKSKNAKIARIILDAITRIDFIGYLYDDNDMDSCISRSEILLDRYLNTPDKGSNETPLHIAVKHGAIEVVKVLLSYSQCQKNNVYNRFNELPKDVICTRVSGPCEETKAAIAALLEDQYFVPVLRSEDNSLQPRVGEAFSLNNPLKVESDILSPRLEIQAYAGPMTKEKAEMFKRKWRNPRSIKEGFSLRLRDTEKGLEKTGRNLASELKVPWQEYWSFLDTFVDISSPEGLQLLENYLKNRFQETLELPVRTEITSSSACQTEKSSCSINDLCETFELCGSSKKLTSTPRSKRHLTLGSGFSEYEMPNKKTHELLKSDGKNPLVYVERSCEVFGKRINQAISSCVVHENLPECLKECLETQIKHLLTLIKSYKEDDRFQTIDFQLIHSRVAAIAIQSLRDITSQEKQAILTALSEIDWSDGALSDDEDLNYNYKNSNGEWMGVTTKRQLHCLVKHLITQLRDFHGFSSPQLSPSARGESDCQMLWSLATSCSCTWGCNVNKRVRGGLKRKQFRNDCDCDCNVSPRKIQFEEEKEISSEILSTPEDDSEDNFATPPTGNSDTEDMEDVREIPNTFIFPGSLPTKADFAVLEAIENVPLSPEKYPNIYLWRHILLMQPKSAVLDPHNCSPELLQRKHLNFDSPKSSPRKFLERSFGSCETSPLQTPMVEPWERVTGPYSPRRSMRSSISLLHCENFPMSR